MTLLEFYSTLPGRFVIQSVLHSMVALFIVETMIRLWGVNRPMEKFRLRAPVIILPVLLFPVFEYLNPTRGTVYFSEQLAVFSSLRWLGVDFAGLSLPAWFFVLVLFITSSTTLFQEVLPLWREHVVNRDMPSFEDICQSGERLHKRTGNVSSALGVRAPRVYICPDDEPVIFVRGTGSRELIVSEGLIESLTCEELDSAIAHELAHVARKSNALTLLAFGLRLLMFYNPVSLLVFRALVHNEELICDEMAARFSGSPGALAGALEIFYADHVPEQSRGIHAVAENIGKEGYNRLLSERIERLNMLQKLKDSGMEEESGRLLPAFTLPVVSLLCYFVV